MRRRCCAALAALLAAGAPAAIPAPAGADYGPGAAVASANGTLLGERVSSAPAISDDGRFVVFATAAGAILGSPPDDAEAYTDGIVRRDMVSGAVELVAPPARVRRSDGAVLGRGATGAASISANGRYVLFDTTLPLVAGDANSASDVYVRDMSRPLSDLHAYELVSALDASAIAPDYLAADPALGSRGGRQGYALSDDGRRAVFRTEAPSNLPAGAATAPRAQVLVRLLDERRTLLVTRDAGGAPVAPAPTPEPSPGPVLSGDGRAVAWVDTNAAAQTRMLAGEPPVAAVLWRDIGGAAATATRRVAGTSDPDDPGCPPGAAFPAGGSGVTGPCFGPFAESEAQTGVGANLHVDSLGISDDGRRVLFRTPAQQRPFDATTAGTHVFLADMSAGLPRKQAVARVVRELGGGAPLEAVLAGSGTRLAFSSAGTTFQGLQAIGALPGGPAQTNAFVVDMTAGIVQRATIGADGTDLRGPVLDPDAPTPVDPALAGLALSDDAGALAFAAADANLFVGDANGVRDVQVVRGAPGVTIPGSVFAAPAQPPVARAAGELQRPLRPPAAEHAVFGYPDVDARGVARVTVRVPAAGRVVATASAALRGRRVRVARARRRARSAATLRLRVVPSPAARAAARRSGRLTIRISVSYAPARGRASSVARSYVLTRSAAR